MYIILRAYFTTDKGIAQSVAVRDVHTGTVQLRLFDVGIEEVY